MAVNFTDPTTGKAQQSQGISLRAFLSTLTTSATALALAVLFFLLAKDRFPKI
jgi:hypothetical protein